MWSLVCAGDRIGLQPYPLIANQELEKIMERLDFSGHYLEAKKKLNEAYVMLNNKQYKATVNLIDEIIVELRLMRTAVKTHTRESHE